MYSFLNKIFNEKILILLIILFTINIFLYNYLSSIGYFNDIFYKSNLNQFFYTINILTFFNSGILLMLYAFMGIFFYFFKKIKKDLKLSIIKNLFGI